MVNCECETTINNGVRETVIKRNGKIVKIITRYPNGIVEVEQFHVEGN